MLCNIKTGKLIFCRSTKTVQLFDYSKGNYHHYNSICSNADYSKTLKPKLPERTCIEQPLQSCGRIGISQQSDRDCTPNTVCHMNTDRSDRIVYMQLNIEQFYNDYHKNTGDNSDYSRTDCIQCIASCSNSNQSGKRCIETH